MFLYFASSTAGVISKPSSGGKSQHKIRRNQERFAILLIHFQI